MKSILYGILFGGVAWMLIGLRGTEAAIITVAMVCGAIFGGFEEKLKHYGKVLDRHTEKLYPYTWSDDEDL